VEENPLGLPLSRDGQEVLPPFSACPERSEGGVGGKKQGNEIESDERKTKIIPGIIKACLEKLTRMDICKYYNVCTAQCLSPNAYLAPENSYR
jgi:hypothetical protein